MHKVTWSTAAGHQGPQGMFLVATGALATYSL